MSLIKCYCMLQKGSVTDFTVSELLRENQQGGGGSGKINPLTQIRAKGVTDTMTAEIEEPDMGS